MCSLLAPLGQQSSPLARAARRKGASGALPRIARTPPAESLQQPPPASAGAGFDVAATLAAGLGGAPGRGCGNAGCGGASSAGGRSTGGSGASGGPCSGPAPPGAEGDGRRLRPQTLSWAPEDCSASSVAPQCCASHRKRSACMSNSARAKQVSVCKAVRCTRAQPA